MCYSLNYGSNQDIQTTRNRTLVNIIFFHLLRCCAATIEAHFMKNKYESGKFYYGALVYKSIITSQWRKLNTQTQVQLLYKASQVLSTYGGG